MRTSSESQRNQALETTEEGGIHQQAGSLMQQRCVVHMPKADSADTPWENAAHDTPPPRAGRGTATYESTKGSQKS